MHIVDEDYTRPYASHCETEDGKQILYYAYKAKIRTSSVNTFPTEQ
jgi:hypothetical protein